MVALLHKTLLSLCVVGFTIRTHANDRELVSDFLGNYCLECHSSTEPAAGFDWEAFEVSSLLSHDDGSLTDHENAAWEKAVKRLRARQMPPADASRPDEQEYLAVLKVLEVELDRRAAQRPQPGRTASVRRLTRTEYQNAIRDLLHLEVDVKNLLPADQESHGFDNVTVSDLSPTLLNRYISAAQQVSRLAVGSRHRGVGGVNFRIPPDRTQLTHVEGLPLGTRGGGVFKHTFARAGRYEFQIRLTRDRDEYIEGLHGTHEIDLLIDRDLAKRFTVVAPKKAKKGYQRDDTKSDAHLKVRVHVEAGPHSIGATFPKTSAALLEIKRQPFDASYNRHRHPRPEPAIFEISVTGPLEETGGPNVEESVASGADRAGASEMPCRRRLFTAYPNDLHDEQEAKDCAEEILRSVMRRAYRRPVTTDDLQTPLSFFESIYAEHGFDAGIESALAAVLVNPNFFFRIETGKIETDKIEAEPNARGQGGAYRVSDVELASRLSFFLWSSIPDDVLLSLAEENRLHEPAVLRQQVLRMLKDERAKSLATNFADQWLYLRNLESFTPDLRLFPDFDDNLRAAMRRETQLLFQCVLQEDRNVLDLLNTDFTFLNERLAKHYGIPGVQGSHFRRIQLDKDYRRGGLLRHGSVLAVTSYATRTSPTIRGNWVLENLLGTPAPPPPPNVPALKEKLTLTSLSIRERLAEHRANPQCAACHNLMDPVGFSLENYDAVGRWRDYDGEQEIDASGALPDGTRLDGVADIEAGLLVRPEMFVGTLTEKLLTYALGRGIEPSDGPAVRKMVRDAAKEKYKLSSIILGIVESVPFQMREAKSKN